MDSNLLKVKLYMKKILYFVSLLPLLLSTHLHSDTERAPFSALLTAGYVFKHDCTFKEVYGRGVINAITGDFCYYPCKHGGIGAKISYWRKKGCTEFLQLRAIVQETPITVYLRAIKKFECNLDLYGSIGGGAIWTKEKSYLGKTTFWKGIGELEVGTMYPIWKCIEITGALRYLFPPQTHNEKKVNVGGVDVRAGIGFTF
jgi:hypothetical protein